MSEKLRNLSARLRAARDSMPRLSMAEAAEQMRKFMSEQKKDYNILDYLNEIAKEAFNGIGKNIESKSELLSAELKESGYRVCVYVHFKTPRDYGPTLIYDGFLPRVPKVGEFFQSIHSKDQLGPGWHVVEIFAIRTFCVEDENIICCYGEPASMLKPPNNFPENSRKV